MVLIVLHEGFPLDVEFGVGFYAMRWCTTYNEPTISLEIPSL